VLLNSLLADVLLTHAGISPSCQSLVHALA